MRSFIKSHKRIGSFGKDDKDKKENTTRPSPSTASTNYSNPTTRPSEIKKQPSFEVLSTNNPNVHPGFTYSTTPIGSPQIANPITPVLKNNELPLPNPFMHSPKMGHDEFYGSTPSSPKTLFKQYSFPLENPPGNSKKKILKYPKNLFSRSSNTNLRESARETYDSTHTNYTNNIVTAAKNQQWTGATTGGPVSGSPGLFNSSGGHFGDEEDEFYFRDYNQDMTSPTVQANGEPKITQNTGVGLGVNAQLETKPSRYNYSPTSSHSTNKDTVSGELFTSFQGFPRKSPDHSDIPVEKEGIPARRSPYLSKEEWERKLNVPSHTLQPELDDFKHKVRNFNPAKSPVIYEEARNKSLQKLLGQEVNNESSSISIKDGSSTNELQSQISLYSHIDEVSVLHVRPKSPTSTSEGINNTDDEDDDSSIHDSKRDSVNSSKSTSKRDSLKNVFDKVKNYKRKSGGSDKNRSSIASVVEDHRASVIQINTDKRASILKKLKKHDSANGTKKVSIKESVNSSNIIAEEEEERSTGSEQTSLTDSNSSTFSFERDLINGRNVSIRYYKSISEREREKANNVQSTQGLYVDDFNADEYGEEDFNEDMNYYDDEEADDTEHLFNRQLFSDDEHTEQDDGMYDDLMDEVNGDDNDEAELEDDGAELDNDKAELDNDKAELDDDKAESINEEFELDKNENKDKNYHFSDNVSEVSIEDSKRGSKKNDNIETETSKNDKIKMEFDINALLTSIESHSNYASQVNIVSKIVDDSSTTSNAYHSTGVGSQKVSGDNSNGSQSLSRLEEETVNIDNELAKDLAELKVHNSENSLPTQNEIKNTAVNTSKEFISAKEKSTTMSVKSEGNHSKNNPFFEASDVKTSLVGTVDYPKPPKNIDDSMSTSHNSAENVRRNLTGDVKSLLKSSSETFEEEQIGNRYSWLSQGNSGAGDAPCESFYEGDTINDYFENDDEYLDEINIVPEDFEFEPDTSYHVYDNRRKEIFSAKTESELIKNRMYRSNSYSKKPKPGGLPFSEALPSQNNFISSNNGRKITLFNSSGFKPINQVIDIDKVSIKEKHDSYLKSKDFLKSANATTNTTTNTTAPTTTTADFLSPINESFNDDAHTTR